MRKIAIIAGGKGLDKCPFDMETWVFGKTVLQEGLKRVDRIILMDDIETLADVQNGVISLERFKEVIKMWHSPFYCVKAYDDIPNSIEYPLKEVSDYFETDFFTNTFSYMIALAIYEGVDEIHFYGVSQRGFWEFFEERRGMEFWLGFARGFGVDIFVEKDSSLLKNTFDKPYGFTKNRAQRGDKPLQFARDLVETLEKGI